MNELMLWTGMDSDLLWLFADQKKALNAQQREVLWSLQQARIGKPTEVYLFVKKVWRDTYLPARIGHMDEQEFARVLRSLEYAPYHLVKDSGLTTYAVQLSEIGFRFAQQLELKINPQNQIDLVAGATMNKTLAEQLLQRR